MASLRIKMNDNNEDIKLAFDECMSGASLKGVGRVKRVYWAGDGYIIKAHEYPSVKGSTNCFLALMTVTYSLVQWGGGCFIANRTAKASAFKNSHLISLLASSRRKGVMIGIRSVRDETLI